MSIRVVVVVVAAAVVVHAAVQLPSAVPNSSHAADAGVVCREHASDVRKPLRRGLQLERAGPPVDSVGVAPYYLAGCCTLSCLGMVALWLAMATSPMSPTSSVVQLAAIPNSSSMLSHFGSLSDDELQWRLAPQRRREQPADEGIRLAGHRSGMSLSARVMRFASATIPIAAS